MSGKTVNSVFSTGNQDLGNTYFDALCLKEHGFTHWRQWSRLVTSGKGKFRWLDYPNLSALDKSCEMYSFHRCFSSCRRCKKGKTPEWPFFFRNICPRFFSWALCSATDTRLKVHSLLTRTSEVSRAYYVNNIFTFKKQEQFSWHKCKTVIFQHIINFMVGMWSYLRESRKCRHFHHSDWYY